MHKNNRLSQQRLPSNSRGLANKQNFSSPTGIEIIGQLAAKYWLLENQTKKESEDGERVHKDDDVGTSVS